MSDVIEEHEQEIEAPETGLIRRSFATEMSAGDGRTIDVRIVPYGTTIEHNDGTAGLPRGVRFKEEWMPGVFKNQERAPNRVLANFEHEEGLRGVVGHGKMLREAPDGFYGSFRMHDNADGDKALMLVKEGVLGGVSLEAHPVRGGTIRGRDGVVRRVKARLVGIALCRTPAFDTSVVLAIRQAAEVVDEELLPVDIDPDLIQRCRALGIRLPERLKAPPAESGPPDTSGTPEDGTRPHGSAIESSEV